MRIHKMLAFGMTMIASFYCLFSAGCQDKQEKAPPRATAVSVTKSVSKPMPVELKTFGTVEAYATVSVRSQLTGEMWKVHIKPGQYVDGPKDNTLGTLLFTIDPRPLQAAYDKAKADLESSQANAKDARRRADDLKRLYEAHAGAYDEMRTAQAIADALESKVSSDRSAMEQAALNLDYASISSPIDGRAGDVLVKAGNLVKANDDVLATITKIKPIYVTFSVPQTSLAPIREQMAKSDLEVVAELKCQDKVERIVKGVLTFVNNSVDVSTGTILLKATFKNTKEVLWPGQFVNVTLVLGIQPNAIVVPSQAVQVGQKGQYVYVVGPGNKVQPAFVTVDREVGEESVIGSGLEAGQTVVTDGQLRLFPGALVKIEKPVSNPSAATASAETQPVPESKPDEYESKASKIQPDEVSSQPGKIESPPKEVSSRPRATAGRSDVSDVPASQPASASRRFSTSRPESASEIPASLPAGNNTRKPFDNEGSVRPAVKRPAQEFSN